MERGKVKMETAIINLWLLLYLATIFIDHARGINQ